MSRLLSILRSLVDALVWERASFYEEGALWEEARAEGGAIVVLRPSPGSEPGYYAPSGRTLGYLRYVPRGARHLFAVRELIATMAPDFGERRILRALAEALGESWNGVFETAAVDVVVIDGARTLAIAGESWRVFLRAVRPE